MYPFDDPIPLPDGGELRTLRDAGNYITELPEAEHDALRWRTAIETLMFVVEHDGQTLLARVAMMRAASASRARADAAREAREEASDCSMKS